MKHKKAYPYLNYVIDNIQIQEHLFVDDKGFYCVVLVGLTKDGKGIFI